MSSGERELPKDTVIGGWKIGKRLGAGGQGVVFEARATEKHAPPRALKVCFAEDDRARGRFKREVDLLKMCQGPHVLALIEAHPTWEVRVEGRPAFAYYVSELCEGAFDDLKVDLGDARRRLSLFREACVAVSHLHTMSDPVIHRDIKPANFLLAREPRRVVIADFGIAKNELAPSDLTATREVVGTQHFRAPEIVNGTSGNVQSDVYSLGRVLEWLMTGAISTDFAIRPVPRGRELDDDACEAIDRVTTKATVAVVGHRFASVKELMELLPDLWLTIKPRPRLEKLSTLDAKVVLPEALALARAGDRLGWFQLENQLRRAYADQVMHWRTNEEGRPVQNVDELFACADRLVESIGGRLALSLAGIASQSDPLSDQSRLVEDLLSITSKNWNGGLKYVYEAPRGLVFLAQYLHGALCCHVGRLDLALQFAATPVPEENRNGQQPLWSDTGMTGWPGLFGEKADDAWRYIKGLYGRLLDLPELFALQTDMDVGLASYSMSLCLLEFAHAVPELRGKSDDELKALKPWLSVAPLFGFNDDATIRTAAARVFGKPSVTKLLAGRAGVAPRELQALWPMWRGFVEGSFKRSSSRFFTRWQLGDLG
jgi:serine/threonine protein kinase